MMPSFGYIIKKGAKYSGLVTLGLIALLLLLAIIPVSTSGLVSSADPAASYIDAARRIQGVIDDESGKVCGICGTTFYTHGDKTANAVVLIHGLTNSPRQFWELGQEFYDDGYNVFIPRMPYHGLSTHTVSELGNLHAQDLQTFSGQVADIAVGLGDNVVVVGLSGGGTIAADIAQHRSGIDKAVLIAPLFGLAGVPQAGDTMLGNLFSRFPDVTFSSSSEPPRDSVYLGWSTRGIAEYLIFSRVAQPQTAGEAAQAGNIVLVTNGNDHTVNNNMSKEIAAEWESSGATITRYEFDASLGLPHDYIDMTSIGEKSTWVYPILIGLIE